jgi:hypothetical protein
LIAGSVHVGWEPDAARRVQNLLSTHPPPQDYVCTANLEAFNFTFQTSCTFSIRLRLVLIVSWCYWNAIPNWGSSLNNLHACIALIAIMTLQPAAAMAHGPLCRGESIKTTSWLYYFLHPSIVMQTWTLFSVCAH